MTMTVTIDIPDDLLWFDPDFNDPPAELSPEMTDWLVRMVGPKGGSWRDHSEFGWDLSVVFVNPADAEAFRQVFLLPSGI